jgi:hypothetical protein
LRRFSAWRLGLVFVVLAIGILLITFKGGISVQDLLSGSSSGATTACPEPTDPPKAWPGSCWRPFSASSPFNQRLPADPRLAPGSARMIEGLSDLVGGGGPATIDIYPHGQGGDPVYWSRPSDPTFTIHCTKPWGRCPLEDREIQIPAGAEPERDPGSPPVRGGTDRHLSVVDVADQRVYDLWQVQRKRLPASGGQLYISWGGVTSLRGSGIDGHGDATASHFSNIAGRVRAEELAAGKIEHALFIDVPCDGVGWVYPARAAGGACQNGDEVPPMGSRLQLDYTPAEIEALHLPPWQRTLLLAMSEYGMFIGDTGSTSLFSIERESGLQYSSTGHRDPWLWLARHQHISYSRAEGGVYIADLAAGVDWSRLRVIAPCVSSNTC